MKIHNPHRLPTIDYRKLKLLQENLKDLSTDNHDKLLKVLQKRGLTVPLFVWQDEKDLYILDGNQRHRVMMLNDLNDDGNYEVPYVLVAAPDKKTAVEQLLEIASQYGTTTVDGLDELAAMYELDVDDLDINFDAVNVDKLWNEPEDEDEPETKDKSKRYTIDQLKDLREKFVAERGMPDNGLVDWIAEREK